VDLLDARNSDLARRVDELARLRFGLAGGNALDRGPAARRLAWLVEGRWT
jgi:hypothetical protein